MYIAVRGVALTHKLRCWSRARIVRHGSGLMASRQASGNSAWLHVERAWPIVEYAKAAC